MKKTIEYITAAVAIGTTIVVYIYALFFYRFSFNYETDINGQYFAALIAASGAAVTGILLFFRKDYSNVQYWGVIVLSLLLLVPVAGGTYSFGNEYWTVILAVAILFVSLVFIPVRLITIIPCFLLVMLFCQLGLAFTQIDGWELENGQNVLKGSLQNSGVFSCYLAIHLPLLYWSYSQSLVPGGKLSGQILKYLKGAFFLFITFFIFFIIVCSKSRSGGIGAGVAVASQLLFAYGGGVKARLRRIPRWGIGFLVVLFIPVLAYAARYFFFLKKASALGRAMKWQIAAQHIGEHFFTGTGIGRFSWYYPQWQAQYFAGNPNPPGAYFLNAGESYIVFNEYLQLFETVGVLGFACFLLLLYWFFTSRSEHYPKLLSAIKATMTALLATGFTTYTFHVNVLQILFVICLAVAAVISQSLPARKIFAIPMLLFAFLLTYTAFSLYPKWRAAETWKAAREDFKTTDAAFWSGLNKYLYADGKFLTEYGRWQLGCGHPEAAVITLEKARQYFISRKMMEALAVAYEQSGSYVKAIETRQWLCNYLPNRFAARYELLKLYRVTGDMAGARKIANIILTMPVKIPSSEVDKIKEEARNMQW